MHDIEWKLTHSIWHQFSRAAAANCQEIYKASTAAKCPIASASVFPYPHPYFRVTHTLPPPCQPVAKSELWCNLSFDWLGLISF